MFNSEFGFDPENYELQPEDIPLIYEQDDNKKYKKFDRNYVPSIRIPQKFTKEVKEKAIFGVITRTKKVPCNITKIAPRCFMGWDNFKEIKIEALVTEIGESAFANCSSLEKMEIPNTVKYISVSAFKCCTSLKSVLIPYGVTRIGQEAFYSCTALKSIEIPESVTTISISAFENCTSLEKIKLPNSLKTICKRAFANCNSNLASKFANCNSNLASKDGFLEIPQYVEKIEEDAFLGIKFISYYGVNTIGKPWGAKKFISKEILIKEIAQIQAEKEAKKRKEEEKIRQAEEKARREAEEEARRKAEIARQKAEEEKKKAEEEARKQAEAEARKKAEEAERRHRAEQARLAEELAQKEAEEEARRQEEERIRLEEEARRQEEEARRLATPEPLVLNDESIKRLYELNKYVNSENKDEITEIHIPSYYFYPTEADQKYKIAKIEDSSFQNSDLRSLIIDPNSVEEIGEDAFRNCELLETVTLSEGLKEIGNSAFKACSNLRTIEIPNGIKKLSVSLFENCPLLEKVILPSTLEEIERKAFKDCQSLKEIVLPYGLKKIGASAFEECSNLKSLDIPKTVDTIDGDATFSGIDTIRYNGTADGEPWGAYDIKKYEEHIPSSKFSSVPSRNYNDFVPVANVQKTVSNTQKGANVKEITLTEDLIDKLHSLKVVNMDADSIVIPITYLDKGVIYRITKIGESAFKGYKSLNATIQLPQGLEEICDYAFYGCKNLKNLVIPNSVRSIGYNAFYAVPQIEYSGNATGSPWGAKSIVGTPSSQNVVSLPQYNSFDFDEPSKKIAEEVYSSPVSNGSNDLIDLY